MSLTLDRFLNLTYFYATENAEEQEKNQFDTRLNMPDAKARASGRIPEGSMFTKENEEAALSGFLSSVSGRST